MSELDRDLEAAVDIELHNLDKPPHRPRPGYLRAMDNANTPRPDRAADQIAMACQGLLKAEDELRGLARDIVGDLADHEKEEPSSDGPLLPRLRSDAELLARLAIRLVRLCEEVRAKL